MFDEIKRLDVKERAEVYRGLIAEGIVTPNEVRKAEGIPPNEGGDVKCQRGNVFNVQCKVAGENATEATSG